MSILDIGVGGWRAFWANVTAPGSMGLYIAVLIIAVLVGFAFRRESSAVMIGARIIAFMMAFVMLIGFIGVLGVDMTAFTPMVDWVLREIQAPFYIQQA